jgi:hypothetical protein
MGVFRGKPAMHLIPPADYIEHEKNSECICGPKITELPNGRMYTHYSLDGREFREKKTDG